MKNLRVTLNGYGSDGVTITIPEIDDHGVALLEAVAAQLDQASKSVGDPYLTIGDPE